MGYCDLRIRVSSEGNLNPNIDDNDDFISGLSEDPEEARKMAAKMRELAVYMQTVTGSPSTDTVTVEFRWVRLMDLLLSSISSDNSFQTLLF